MDANLLGLIVTVAVIAVIVLVVWLLLRAMGKSGRSEYRSGAGTAGGVSTAATDRTADEDRRIDPAEVPEPAPAPSRAPNAGLQPELDPPIVGTTLPPGHVETGLTDDPGATSDRRGTPPNPPG
jgi:hypothetical protein